MTQKIKSAGLILFRESANESPRFLLLFSRVSKYWGFPKGGRKIGESDMKAAIREDKEETGIDNFFILVGFKTAYQYSYNIDGKRFREKVALYAAKTKTSKIKLSNEHLKYKWADYETARKMIPYPNIKGTLERLNIFLKNKANIIGLQEKVYKETAKISRGEISSYEKIGKKTKTNPRTVGLFLSRNYDPRVPCHRVVRSDGKVGGYNKGTREKIRFLKREGVRIKRDRVIE